MLDRLGAVCGETARLLACDAGLTRVITDGASQPLDVGREQRTVSPANAKPWPSATAAASAVSWEPPGSPGLAWLRRDRRRADRPDQSGAVCWRCHRDIHHTGNHPIRRPDGRWRLRRC